MNEAVRRQWQFIQEEAKRLGLPVHNKRSVLREYLQIRILDYIFSCKSSAGISFMGGTCLRLIYDQNRFSEDLDFDVFDDSAAHMIEIVTYASQSLTRDGYSNELFFAPNGNTAALKFPDMLYHLQISTHRTEKLHIKIDWDTKARVFEPEIVVVSRFGVVQRMCVNSASAILAEKIAAVLSRKRSLPRDFYDIAGLLKRNILPDQALLASLNIDLQEACTSMIARYHELSRYQIEKELKPFIFDNRSLTDLQFFEDLVNARLRP